MTKSRPATLAEVAQRVLGGAQWRTELADFVDEFYEKPSSSSLAEEPQPLVGRTERGAWRDAYLAAVAEQLWRKAGGPRPGWIDHKRRFLPEPWFSYQTREGRLYLLAVSPPGFKARNLFVPKDALVRV